MTEQYETLRSAALGEVLPLEARSGLALFLRRGMWGWARAAAIPATPPQLMRRPSPGPAATGEQRAVLHLFAAMAMRAHAPESPSP